MTKKPVNAGPTDVVIALDAVARKIAKLLDDNGMILDVHKGTVMVGSWEADHANGNVWTAVTVGHDGTRKVMVFRG